MSSTAPPRAIDVAYTLHVRGRLTEAEARYRQIIADDAFGQDGMNARNNLLDLLRSQGRWVEAEALIREALAVRAGDDDWRYRLGSSLLADGRYAEGWSLFEARRGISRARVAAPPLPFPEWRGESVGSLLIWPEQGFGDVIQFSRYLPLLRDRGISVSLVCQAPLTRLLAPLADHVASLQGGMALPPQDAWSLIGSLPLCFGTTLQTLPPPALLAPAAGGGRTSGVGVVTRGQPQHFNDRNRSLPDDLAAELLDLPGAISLRPEDTGATDFQATAEIVAGLERVITVDTAVAHLAASMGKPTWILTPYLNTDWRWMRERSDSPWYPSARLYRQPAPGDWRSVVDAVRRDLREEF